MGESRLGRYGVQQGPVAGSSWQWLDRSLREAPCYSVRQTLAEVRLRKHSDDSGRAVCALAAVISISLVELRVPSNHPARIVLSVVLELVSICHQDWASSSETLAQRSR